MLNFTVEYDGNVAESFHKACTAAEVILATQVMKDTAKYVPALTKSLMNRTHIENGNTVVYPGPYARYLYFGKYMVDERGRGPFPTVDGPRYHRGAVLHATEKDLVISTAVNPLATSHWPEVSKRANMKKWMNVVAKAVSKNA